MLGQLSSSLHRLKDVNNTGACDLLVPLYSCRRCQKSSQLCANVGFFTDGGFFVFGDISVRHVGTYRLRFYLFDLQK